MNNTLSASMNNLMLSSSDSINSIEKNNSFEAKKKRVQATLERKLQKKTEAPNSTNVEQNNLLIEVNQDNNRIQQRKTNSSRIITFFRVLKNKICCNNDATSSKKVVLYNNNKEKKQASPLVSTTLEPIYYELEKPNSKDEHIYDKPKQQY
jgi:hypothetical protein